MFEYPEARVKLHELTMDATKKKEEEEEEGEEVNPPLLHLMGRTWKEGRKRRERGPKIESDVAETMDCLQFEAKSKLGGEGIISL